MFKNFIKSKKAIFITLLISITLIVSTFVTSFGIADYEKLDFVTGFVTASALNIRKGPGLNYEVVGKVYKNEYIRVFAKIGDWYVIQTDSNIIGAVYRDYVRPIYPETQGSTDNTPEPTPQATPTPDQTNSLLSVDEQAVLDLINSKRQENGLDPLEIDEELQNVARLKAQDMVDNNYFSHTSPTYGTPFEMIKSFGISYKTSGENIAGNSSNEGAVNAWMNSQGHKDNILNKNYNYTGIGVVNSPIYGKIYVQMFIGK